MVPTTGKYSFDIDDNEMEIGIGIHGEKGYTVKRFNRLMLLLSVY